MQSRERDEINNDSQAVSAAIGSGTEGIVITTADGGMRARGGLGATATTITGLAFALRSGDMAPPGITAAMAYYAFY